MAWPSGMTLCTISIGQIRDSLGNPAKLSGSFELSLPPGVKHLVWTAEESSITDFAATIEVSGDGSQLGLTMPHVDQEGIAPPDGITVNGLLFAGILSVRATYANGGTEDFQIPLQPQVGTDSLDIDPKAWLSEGSGVTLGIVTPIDIPTAVQNILNEIVTDADTAMNPVLADDSSASITTVRTKIAGDVADSSTVVGSALSAAQVALATDASKEIVGFNDGRYTYAGPRPVIWDSDFQGDCDDPAALRLLLHAERIGLVSIRAIIQDCKVDLGPAAIDTVVSDSGRAPVAIGVHPHQLDGGTSSYVSTMAASFPHRVGGWSSCSDSTAVYRRALADADDATIDIIVVGYLTALADLMASSADAISPLTGADLLAAKVRHLWIMGGEYPSGSEHNFNKDAVCAAAAAAVITGCQAPTTFLGYEVGMTALLGANIASGYATDPVAAAFHARGNDAGEQGWDPMLTWMACLGSPTDAGYRTVGGVNTVDPATGANTFTAGSGAHAYVVQYKAAPWFVTDLNSRLVRHVDPAIVRATPPPAVRSSMASSLNSTGSLIGWWHADDLSGLADGATIPTWPDRCNQRPLSPGPGSSSPTKGTFSTKTSVEFVSGQYMVSPEVEIGAEITMLIRLAHDTVPAGNVNYFSAAVENSHMAKFFRFGTGANSKIGIGSFDLNADPSSAHSLNSAGTLTTGGWQTHGARLSATTARVYRNGAADGDLALPIGHQVGTSFLAVGSGSWAASLSPFAGRIRQIRVYDRALTDAEVTSEIASIAS